MRVRAGDLVLADRRLRMPPMPTAARSGVPASRSRSRRPSRLPGSVQARIVTNSCLPPPDWWRTAVGIRDVDPRLRPLLPRYAGTAEPVPIG